MQKLLQNFNLGRFSRLALSFCLVMVMAMGVSWGQNDEVVYTLTPASGSNNSYTGNCDITIDEITWNLTGNSQQIPWRIGGKSLTGVERTLYSKTAISDNVSKIEVTHGAASSIVVNSWTVIVASDASFSNVVSTLTPTFAADATTTINRPVGADWSNCYYKFVYNVTVSGSSNKFLEFSRAKFYKETGGDTPTPTTYTVTYDANGGTGTMTDDDSPYDAGSTVTVLSNAFSRDNFIFDHWNTAANGDGTDYDEGDNFTINSNTTLYAQWTENTTPGPTPGGSEVTYDFTSIDGFSGWESSYIEHVVQYPDATVTFASANKNSQTITNQPVTKGGDVTLVLTDGSTMSSATFVCTQWGSKAQTITLHYSTNEGQTYTSTGITSSNFTITSSNLPSGTNAVKITFSSSSNQVGIASATIVKVSSSAPSIAASDVNLTYDATGGSIAYTINNEPDPAGTLTATTTSDWLNLNQVTTSPIAFTCTANENTAERTAMVTLTYTYGNNETVTKDVTVTQAAAPVIYTTIPAIFSAATATPTNVNVTFGNWVVSGVQGSNAFVTDNNGNGFIIYCAEHGFAVNDKLGGTVMGTPLKLFKGSAEFTNLLNTTDGLSVSHDGAITVIADKTIADLGGVNTGAVIALSNLTYDGTNLSDGTNTIKPYSTLFEGTFVNGHIYNVTGVYQQYDNTKEILPRSAADIEEVASITVDPTTINVLAEGGNGTITITYNNITNIVAQIQLCDGQGGLATYNWITATLNSDNNIQYTVSANTGAARTAYFKVYALDDDGEDVYSNLITVTQAEYVIDYATLPFVWGGGTKEGLVGLTGVSGSGLGSNYAESNAPYRVKFDNDGDYILIKTNQQPGVVTLGVKKLGGAGVTSISVQGSSDGENFTTVQEFSNEGTSNAVLDHETNVAFGADVRYVRIYFNKPSNGSNVGVGPITIAVVDNTPSIVAHNNVDIAYNAISGNIDYTINNVPDPAGTLTAAVQQGATIGNLVLGTVTSSAVPFTCDANTSGTARTATVTLTYAYGDNETVTKDVTITQAAAPQQYTLEVTSVTNAEIFVFDATDPDDTNWDYLFDGVNSVPVAEGTPIALSVSADNGYVIQSLMVNNVNHVSDITSDGTYTFLMPAENVTITVTAMELPSAADYVLYSGNLVEGDYLIVYDNGAMKNTISSDRLQYESVTPNNDVIHTDNAAIVWHIAQDGDYWTIYSAAVGKYAASTGSKNQAQMITNVTDNARWTVSTTNNQTQYEFENKARAASSSDPNNKWLRKNGNSGYACYAVGTGGALSLYKKVENTPYTVTLATSPVQTLTETAAGAGVDLPALNAVGSYAFSGWCISEIAEETTNTPAIIPAGHYHPQSDIELHPVYVRVVASGETRWVLTELSAVTPGTYALLTTDYYAFNGTVNNQKDGETTLQPFTFTNNVATSAPNGTCELEFESANNGFTMRNANTNQYLYASDNTSGHLGWHTEETSYWSYKFDNWVYEDNNAYLRSYTNNRFKTYQGNTGDLLKLAKKLTGVSYYTSFPECPKITAADLPWNETFEGYTTVTTPNKTGINPDCWTFVNDPQYPNTADTARPQMYYGNGKPHAGNYCLYMFARGTTAMPQLEEGLDVSDLKMTFWLRQHKFITQLQVGVMTDPNDLSTFTPLATFDNGSSTEAQLYEVDFSQYTISDNPRYIAFCNIVAPGYTQARSVQFIDDITIALAEDGTCPGITELDYSENFDNVTENTSVLTGALPDCWTWKEETEGAIPAQVSYDANAQSGSYSLYMSGKGYVVLPELNVTDVDLQDVQMSFYVRQRKYAHRVEVGVMDDNGIFTPLETIYNGGNYTTPVQHVVDFSTYEGSGKIAFHNVAINTNTMSYNWIDDISISVSESQECEGITDLSSYEEAFDAVPAGTLPECWSWEEEVEGSGATPAQVSYDANAHSGSYSLYMSGKGYAVMPELNVTGVEIQDVQMSFYVRQRKYAHRVEVGVMEEDGTFTLLETIYNGGNYTTPVQHVVDFSTYSGTGKRIAFHNIAINTNTVSQNWIDDITLSLATSTPDAVAEMPQTQGEEPEEYVDDSANTDFEEVMAPTGISDFDLSNLTVYPNPTTGMVTIVADEVSRVEVYNQIGVLVARYTNEQVIDLGNLSNGVYVLRVTTPQGVAIRKVVKK